MWKQIADNKRNSFFVFIAMSVLLVLVGAGLGLSLAATVENVCFFAVLTMLIYWVAILVGKSKSMPISVGDNIYKCEKSDNPKLYNIVEEMAIASGMQGAIPDIYIMDTPVPNAFASGFSPQKSAVCVTTGLLELCNRDELQGVIAHEIAHIVNRDTTYLLYASIVISMITTMARVFARSSGRRSSNSSGGILDIVVLIIMIIAPLLAHIFYFMLSRKREYLADACAVQFTRYPVGLASALNKISGNTYLSCLDDKVALKQFNENPFLKASCIVPAFSNKRDGWFSTHPSTMNRIKILMKMSESADFSNYNSAYCSITKSKPIIPISDIHNSTKIPIRLGEPMVGLVGLVGAEMTPEVQKLECGERIERRREVEDMMWKYERYRFINCSCETRLKIPPTFKGKEVTCPHCKTKHILS